MENRNRRDSDMYPEYYSEGRFFYSYGWWYKIRCDSDYIKAVGPYDTKDDAEDSCDKFKKDRK